MSNESELRQIVANLSDGPTVCVTRYACACGFTHWNRASVKSTTCDISGLEPDSLTVRVARAVLYRTDVTYD